MNGDVLPVCMLIRRQVLTGMTLTMTYLCGHAFSVHPGAHIPAGQFLWTNFIGYILYALKQMTGIFLEQECFEIQMRVHVCV